ncbi:MAG TPA: PilZ domain-containing protein [Verrucomicrobiae bacterium]|nr:PilZ domain-containing protein [Verrucomicrobiae bacterium]
MPDSLPRMPRKGPLTTERRQNPRHPVRPTEYIEIGDSNGGIILDISESGMAVASAQALVGNQTLLFRFQLPRSNEIIETSGKINWIGETKKRAGVRFVDLPLAARKQIQKWIDSEISGHSDGDQQPSGSAVASPSPKIPKEFPRRELVHQEVPREKTTISHAHNPSRNLNPVSSVLSNPLDEPEIEESEPQVEEKATAGSNADLPPERRVQHRLPMTASTYVQLNDGNGGLMANLSKTGFCVRAAKTLESDELPVVRFQLPDVPDFVESSAWIVWKSPSKKMVGARFESLSDEAQSQIAHWIDSQPLPKNAPIKNPLREKMPPAPTAPPVTLMAPDSVPIPAYISPLAISRDAQNAQPATPSAKSPSSTRSLAPFLPPAPKVPPISSPTKSSAPSREKTLAPVPVAPLAPMALTNNAPRLTSPAPPRVVTPPSPNLAGKSLSSQPLLDTSRGVKNPWDQFAPAPTSLTPLPPTPPLAPIIFNEPDWSVAPKRPRGYWKIAAIIAVIVGTLFGTATLLRSKKSPTLASPESPQNSPVAANVSAVTPSADPAVNKQPTPSSTASTSNSESSREFYDATRNTTPSISPTKGDEQFVDEPRPAHSQPQIANPPIPSNSASSTASDQPASSVTQVQNDGQRYQAQPAEEGAGFPTVVRRVPTAPAAVFPSANGEPPATPDSSSSPSATAASRNQQSDTNLASAGITASENTSSPRSASAINAPQATSPAAAQASSTAAAIPNPVPTVSVFSRFRAIRGPSDATRSAGSDLQVGRLKSGPAPPYPVEAQRQQIQGTVELEVLVGTDGSILTVHLVKGPPELASVAMGTARSWQYGQTTLGGHPVETDQSIYFTFKLTK